jgi:hypothetical protein
MRGNHQGKLAGSNENGTTDDENSVQHFTGYGFGNRFGNRPSRSTKCNAGMFNQI